MANAGQEWNYKDSFSYISRNRIVNQIEVREQQVGLDKYLCPDIDHSS